ncbi:hypothetical protein [Streptomyces platensis]|uniref:hypothetical protein n=1 Tax=Streptomyces platensis TaxID=58346 RepID=UPI0036867890
MSSAAGAVAGSAARAMNSGSGSRNRIATAVARKNRETHAYGDIGDHDRVVTDRGTPAEELTALHGRGVTVDVVDV